MRSASGHRKVKMSGSEKKITETQVANFCVITLHIFSLKRVTGKFHVTKKCAALTKMSFLLTRRVDFLPFSLPLLFRITQFYFLCEEIITISIRASLLAQAKSIYIYYYDSNYRNRFENVAMFRAQTWNKVRRQTGGTKTSSSRSLFLASCPKPFIDCEVLNIAT